MTIEEKARAYDESFKEAEKIHKFSSDIAEIKRMEQIFPELAESEDEKIRKALIKGFNECLVSSSHYPKNVIKYWHGIVIEDIVAWLEKQESVGEIVSRCKTSWYNEGKIQGQIEGLSDEEKYQQGWHDALEKQCEQKSADSYCQKNCKGFQETGKCFADWDCKAKREAESIDKVEPKFHEGQWITNGDYTWKIVEVKPLDYILQSEDGNIVDDTISHVDEQFHSFTIEDAKDGDVLFHSDSASNGIFIFKKNN